MAMYNLFNNSFRVVLYIAVITPYKIAYFEKDILSYYIIDVIVDFLFLFDIILSFFGAYFNEN